MALCSAVVEAAEDLVPRCVVGPVVAVEPTMVQLMEERAKHEAAATGETQCVIPGVRRRRSDGVVHQHENHVEWMRRHKQEDQAVRLIDDLFHWVLRQTRPGPLVNVAMVADVHGPIQRRPVKDSMLRVEVETSPVRREEYENDEPERILVKADQRSHAVGVGPHEAHLIRGPDQDTRG